MHLSENDGTDGQGFVGAALCLELLRRGAQEVRSLDLRASSSWSQQLLDVGVRLFQVDVLVQGASGPFCRAPAPIRNVRHLIRQDKQVPTIPKQAGVAGIAGFAGLSASPLPLEILQHEAIFCIQ